MNVNVEMPKTFFNVLDNNHFLQVMDDIDSKGWVYENKSYDNDKILSWTQERENRPVIDKASEVCLHLIEDYLDAKNEFSLTRTHYNGQTFGQHGTKHVDYGPGYLTIVLYVNSFWDAEWGGETYVYKPDNSLIINRLIPNSAILFPSDWLHWGTAPNVINVLRKTVAFSFIHKQLLEGNGG
jgi:hypothetical protein